MSGITILAISGENGIIQRAVEAREEMEEAEKIEQNTLNNYEDTINEYMGIDWDTVLANAQKHLEQKTSTAIGVGTNGRAVNMDLWEYSFDDVTNGYGLNDSVSLTATASADASKGYNGTNFDNIVIPQYISTNEGESWTPVTNLDWLFYNCIELKQINKLPDTVKSMRYTFRGCTNLVEICKLPNKLENMRSAFMQTGIIKMPDIPKSVNDWKQLQQFHKVLLTWYGREDYFRVLYNATSDGLSLKIFGSCKFLNEIITQADNPRITL